MVTRLRSFPKYLEHSTGWKPEAYLTLEAPLEPRDRIEKYWH